MSKLDELIEELEKYVGEAANNSPLYVTHATALEFLDRAYAAGQEAGKNEVVDYLEKHSDFHPDGVWRVEPYLLETARNEQKV